MLLALTILAAIIFSLIAASRRKYGAALGILVMSVLVWPEYYRIPLLVQMSVPRMVAIFLWFKLSSAKNKPKFNSTDFYVLGVWVWTILAAILAGATQAHITQMIGRGLDTAFIYFVVRRCVGGEDDIKALYPALAITSFIMCGMGVYEAITWHSPYHKFYFNLGFEDRSAGYSEVRHGMLRAQGSTLVSIYFGMAMMMLTAMVWSVKDYAEKAKRTWLALLAAFVGTMSCLSSGPWMGIFMFFGLGIYLKNTRFIKPTIYLVLLLCFIIEVASDRHFYNLIDYLALDKATAYYRSRLLEVGISQWHEYWLIGTGSNWPHHWGALVDGRQHVDIVNNFLIIAVYGGLPALVMFVSAHVSAIKRGVKAFKNDADVRRRKLIFGLSAGIISVDVASMSVGIYGAALLLSYAMLGMLVSVATAWKPVEQLDLDFHDNETFEANNERY